MNALHEALPFIDKDVTSVASVALRVLTKASIYHLLLYSQGWGEYCSGTRLAQNDKHEYTKNIVHEYYTSTDFPVLVLVCSVLAPALVVVYSMNTWFNAWVYLHNQHSLNRCRWHVSNKNNYRQVSNIRRTKSQHFKDSRTVLRLSLPNPLNPDDKSRMKM